MNKDILALCIGVVISSSSIANDLDAFLELDLDDLSGFDVEMETATKNSQSLHDIPASVYVISNERIKRSGYSSIAELLSLVPGFLTTKYSEVGYDISSKGFHDSFYNKLLIMVDGRSVYSPVYGGTYMADLDYLIADIEQIEVVRGPAGTMWGANSANGVVNIITKSAQNSQGTHISGYAGEYNNYSAEARHGFSLGDYSFAKVFYKYKHSPSELMDDASIRESHQYGGAYEVYSDRHTLLAQLGGETSSENYDQTQFSLFEDCYSVDCYYYYLPSSESTENASHSWYLNLKHKYKYSDQTQLNTTLYHNYDKDNDPFAAGVYRTTDLDLFALTALNKQNHLTLGGGVRYVNIDFSHHISDFDAQSSVVNLRAATNSKNHDDYTINGYAQLETWWTDKFKTVVGGKYEYFEVNATHEFSPQLRALYNISAHHSVWGGVARAVMLPSYLDTQTDEYTFWESAEYPGTYDPDLYLSDPNLDNESVQTVELGYRYSPNNSLNFDALLFVSNYENLRGISYLPWNNYGSERGIDSDLEGYISYFNADYSAKTTGTELSLNYSPFAAWQLFTNYAYLNLKSNWEGSEYDSVDPGYGVAIYDIEAQHMITLQSLWSVTEQFDADLVGRYFYSDFPEVSDDWEVDPFATLDARFAWQKDQSWPVVELIAQNLLGAGYQYLNSEYSYVNEQKWYARLTYDF